MVKIAHVYDKEKAIRKSLAPFLSLNKTFRSSREWCLY